MKGSVTRVCNLKTIPSLLKSDFEVFRLLNKSFGVVRRLMFDVYTVIHNLPLISICIKVIYVDVEPFDIH